MVRSILILVFLCAGFLAQAADFKGRGEMNGISYKDYEGFEDKWKFVTVRYRSDTGEQRFTWANDIAMRALEAGGTDYPDGAVFAKIGFATEKDPTFESSKVPSGAKRYQFMVRDQKKYASTGGWGYALFDGNRVTYDADPQAQAMACYACHQLVPARGQVFSQPMRISAFASKVPAPIANREVQVAAVKFETLPLKKLPEVVRRSLPENTRKIRSVAGELRKNVFRGTIDEIRPTLIEEVRRTGMPAALVASTDAQFAAVYPVAGRKDCTKKSFKSVFSTEVPSTDADASKYLVVAYQDLCL